PFFDALVQHLAEALRTRFALIAEFREGLRARTLAYWQTDRLVGTVEWDLRGTPCEEVVAGSLCHHPRGVSRQFPTDEFMVEMGIESYLGVPLTDGNGRVLGHLAVFDDRPMPSEARKLSIFRIFAARAGAELQRMRAEQQLRDEERRFRDLFEQAPIGYV